MSAPRLKVRRDVRLRDDVRQALGTTGTSRQWRGDVRVRGLAARYGTQLALDGIDLDIEPGSCVAVLGANGAGKSSLLRALAGSLRPVSGVIRLGDVRAEAMRDYEITRLGVCHVPEGRGIFPGLTVEDNLRLLAANEEQAEALARFPVLAERRSQVAGSLSGGEQQMLSLVRALGGRHCLLLVDELSLGLAPVIVEQLYGTLSSIRAAGRSMVIVEQFADRALELADTAYVLRKGRTVFSGAASELRARGPEFLRALYLGVPDGRGGVVAR